MYTKSFRSGPSIFSNGVDDDENRVVFSQSLKMYGTLSSKSRVYPLVMSLGPLYLQP